MQHVQDLLYALLIAGGKLVTLLHPKKQSVHPSDVHILVSTILSSSSLSMPMSESWIPICLPRFNASGFLHAYVGFVSKGVGMVFVGGDRESFPQMSEWREAVVDVSDYHPVLRLWLHV
jgi:hypothetical protein